MSVTHDTANATITVLENYPNGRVEFSICSDTSRVMFIKSPALASDEFELLLVTFR